MTCTTLTEGNHKLITLLEFFIYIFTKTNQLQKFIYSYSGLNNLSMDIYRNHMGGVVGCERGDGRRMGLLHVVEFSMAACLSVL